MALEVHRHYCPPIFNHGVMVETDEISYDETRAGQ